MTERKQRKRPRWGQEESECIQFPSLSLLIAVAHLSISYVPKMMHFCVIYNTSMKKYFWNVQSQVLNQYHSNKSSNRSFESIKWSHLRLKIEHCTTLLKDENFHKALSCIKLHWPRRQSLSLHCRPQISIWALGCMSRAWHNPLTERKGTEWTRGGRHLEWSSRCAGSGSRHLRLCRARLSRWHNSLQRSVLRCIVSSGIKWSEIHVIVKALLRKIIICFFFVFFLKVFGAHMSFFGATGPLFWIFGDVSSGIRSQSGFCLIRFLWRQM